MNKEASSALLSRAREGSDGAFEEIFARVSGKLLALIRLRLGRALRSEVESADVLQATLLHAFVNFDRFAGSDRPTLMAWLGRIAESEIRSLARYHRAKKRDLDLRVPLGELSANLEPELRSRMRTQTSRLALREEMDRIEAALEKLDEAHREVIVLRHLEELSFAETGERLGRSADAARMLLVRAMAALTLEIEGE